jgi:hypothetical protein
MAVTPAHFHQCFIDGNAHELGIKPRISSKARKVLEGFCECVLHDVFGVLVVAGDVLCQTEHSPLVVFDHFVERGFRSALRSGDDVLFIPFSESTGGWHSSSLFQSRKSC